MNGGTHLTALGLVFLAAMVVLTFALPRRLALLPLFLSACYMTLAQVLSLGGLHFTLLRIVMLVGWARVLAKREHKDFQFNEIDRAVVFWAVSCFVMGILLLPANQGFQYELGEVYNALGTYFLMRVHLRSADDLTALLKKLVWVVLPLALIMLGEHRNGYNRFYVLGGVGAISVSRGEDYRAQGPFAHSILAGTAGVFMVPLFLSLWWQDRKYRFLAIVGAIAGTLMMWACHSSGPLMSYLGVLAGMALWGMRFKMRVFRRVFVAGLLLAQCFMKTPVWYLIAKIAEITGGDGWQRSVVIDVAVKHFFEWWLKGTTVTAPWYPSGVLYTNPDMLDITNEFVNQAVSGGLLRLVLFVVILVRCFRRVGVSLREEADRPVTIWLRGCALLAHVVAFFSVSYFDQISVFWFFSLALISTPVSTLQTRPVPLREDETEFSGRDAPNAVMA